MAKGSGTSKKKAEQDAARIALEHGEWRHQNGQ
jgi:dsRNA-specific ribonuclease